MPFANEADRIANSAKYYQRSRAEILQYKRDWYKANKVKNRLRKYGMTPADYDKRLAEQGFTCALCPTEAWETRDGVLHVDHDHETGKVRGLLCHHCNLGLGHFADDPDRLAAARTYLLDRKM